MIIHYQPVIEIATQRVVRAEVLCRFPDGAVDMQDLKAFIPHAERVGLIRELTESVLLLALSEWKTWGVAPPLSFNVSRLDLEDPAFFERTMDIFKRCGAEPAAITLELNDGIQSIDDGGAFNAMLRLRAAGIRFAVDGFGPTLSTFSYLELERVGVHEVKIDVSGAEGKKERATIASVVDISNQLHLDVVAKGVETAQRLALVSELGCGFAQGYAIAKPMDAESFVAWLATEEIAAPRSAPVASGAGSEKSKSFMGGLFGKRSKT